MIALAPGVERAVNLTVGFRPREVQFDALGTRAYVITQDGVSVVDLGYATTHGPEHRAADPGRGSGVPARVGRGRHRRDRDLRGGPPGGRRRRCGSSTSAASSPGGPGTIPLASPATDIDLAPDGARVYAVQREAKRLAIVDVPGDALDPTGVESVDLTGAAIGSFVLSRDGTPRADVHQRDRSTSGSRCSSSTSRATRT